MTFKGRAKLVILLAVAAVLGFSGHFSWHQPSHFSLGRLMSVSAAEAQPPLGIYTRRYDNSRSGINPNETLLAPNTVNQTTFGLLYTEPVDGWVMAEPLYVPGVTFGGVRHAVVYVATENDSIYAFDANAAGAPLSMVNLLGSGETTVPNTATCPLTVGQTYGIVGNPTIDPATGTLYAVARSELTTGSTTQYFTRLHALKLSNLSGPELKGFPVVISGSVPGTGKGSVGGVIAFDSQIQGQDAALLLATNNPAGGKQLYIGFSGASCGGPATVHGWLFEYDATTGAQLAVFNSTPSSAGGGIWEARSGPAEDANGEIYAAVANGDYNPAVNDYGDTELKFNPATGGSGQLTIVDSFTPSYQCYNNVADRDFGMGGPVLLPPQGNPPTNLLLTEDKYGAVYLLNTAHLGGGPEPVTCSPNTPPPTSPPECAAFPDLPECFFAILPNNGQVLTAGPIFFNGTLFVDPWGGTPEEFTMQDGAFLTSPVASVPANQYLVGQKPEMALSANGTSNALLWIYDDAYFDQDNPSTSGQAMLYAFDPTNLSSPIYVNNKPKGTASPGPTLKFAVPAEINNHVYIGTQTSLAVYGMLTKTASRPITLHGAQSSTVDGATAITVNMPAGEVSGDLLIAQLGAVNTAGGNINLTTPAGWTVLNREPNTSGFQTQVIYWKIAGATEPTSYTWKSATSVSVAGGIAAYGNVNTTSPFDVVSGGYFPTASATVMAPSLTTRHPHEQLLVLISAFGGEPGSWTYPPGMTGEIAGEDADGEVSNAFLDQMLGLPGVVGPRTAQLQTALPTAATAISIRDVQF